MNTDAARVPGQVDTPQRNPFGTASLVCGIVMLVVGILTQALAIALPYLIDDTLVAMRLMPLVNAVPIGLLALTATVLGVIGLLAKGRPRTAAIIGTTLGASTLMSLVLGTIATVVVGAMLSAG